MTLRSRGFGVASAFSLGLLCFDNPSSGRPLERVNVWSEINPDIVRIFGRLRANGEILSVSETYRAYFNREPVWNPEFPILSRLSQGRYPMESGAANLSSASCKSCHAAEHEAWKESLHSKAFVNIRFKEAFAREPQAWCLNCHAPFWYDPGKGPVERTALQIQEIYASNKTVYVVRRDETKYQYRDSYDYAEVDTPLNREGVNCAACHVRAGVIYGARKPSLLLLALASAGIVHDMGSDPSLRTQDFCAGCHEFAFPASYAPAVSYTDQPMQSTVSQFFEVPRTARQEQCVDCHMGGALHASSAVSVHNAARLGEVLQVRFNVRPAAGRSELLVSFRAGKIGHHLPTGDLFRQIRVTAFDGAGKEVIRHTIGIDVDANTFVTYADTRLKVKSRQAIDETLVLQAERQPAHCSAEFLFEGKIDHLHTAAKREERRVSLYEGPCE